LRVKLVYNPRNIVCIHAPERFANTRLIYPRKLVDRKRIAQKPRFAYIFEIAIALAAKFRRVYFLRQSELVVEEIPEGTTALLSVNDLLYRSLCLQIDFCVHE
jgi:hypothetical protein